MFHKSLWSLCYNDISPIPHSLLQNCHNFITSQDCFNNNPVQLNTVFIWIKNVKITKVWRKRSVLCLFSMMCFHLPYSFIRKYLVFILQHEKHNLNSKGLTTTGLGSMRNLNIAVMTTLGFVSRRYCLSFDAINIQVRDVISIISIEVHPWFLNTH